MSTPTPETNVHVLVAGYALDALDPDEVRAFERHLASCQECLHDLEGFAATAARLGAAVPVAPPPALRASVLAAVAATRPVAPVTSLESRRRRPVATWWAAAAAVLMLSTAGAGALAWQAREDVDDVRRTQALVASTLADPDRQLHDAEWDGAPATVVLGDGQAVVLASGVRPTADGFDYQLWVIEEGVPRSVGLLFPSNGSVTAFASDVDSSDTIGVTVEPEGGSVSPTTEPVLLAALTA